MTGGQTDRQADRWRDILKRTPRHLTQGLREEYENTWSRKQEIDFEFSKNSFPRYFPYGNIISTPKT